jgi:type VI secretion system protein ImpB
MDNIQHLLSQVRSPRVQITYDVETNGARVLKELPYIIGILANVVGETTKPIPYAERKFIKINGTNFNDVMAFLGVETNVPMTMKNTEETTNLNIQFNNIHDFHPDHLTQNIPLLKTMKNQLNLWKDFKRKLMANGNTTNKIVGGIMDNSLKQLVSAMATSDNNDNRSSKTKK